MSDIYLAFKSLSGKKQIQYD